MSDVDDFFAEQYDRMNLPNENLEDYVSRMAVVLNRYSYTFSFGTRFISL